MAGGAKGIYGRDLAFVHDAGYLRFAHGASRGIASILRRAGIRGGLVVEFGCGSGGATRGLLAAGHRVLGIDASPAMLALARKRAPRARFVRGRLPAVSIPPCEAVVAVGEVLNYQSRPSDFDRLFRKAARALPPGGLLLFDVRLPAPGPTESVHGSVGSDWAVISRSRERRGRLERAITSFRRVGSGWRRSDETHRLTLLSGADLARRLRRAGFSARIGRRCGALRLPRRIAFVEARRG
jgi:SAM-dependent methyltransferase